MKNRKTKSKDLFAQFKTDKENYIQLLAGGIIASTVVQSCTNKEAGTTENQLTDQIEYIDSTQEDIASQSEVAFNEIDQPTVSSTDIEVLHSDANTTGQDGSIDQITEDKSESAIEEIAEVKLDSYTTSENSSTFEEVFAGAREKFGSSGIFEWQGKTYTTLYEGELSQVTPDYYAIQNESYNSSKVYESNSNTEIQNDNSSIQNETVYQSYEESTSTKVAESTHIKTEQLNADNSSHNTTTITENQSTVYVEETQNENTSSESYDYSDDSELNDIEDSELNESEDITDSNTELQSSEEVVTDVDFNEFTSMNSSAVEVNKSNMETQSIETESASMIDENNDGIIDQNATEHYTSQNEEYDSKDQNNDGIIDQEGEYNSVTRDEYGALDQDNDGIIDFEAQHAYSVSNDEYQSTDQDGDGIIDQESINPNDTNDVDTSIDQNNDGIIDFGNEATIPTSMAIDENRDGIIDFQQDVRISDTYKENNIETNHHNTTPLSEDIIDENEDGIIDEDVEMYMNEDLPFNELLEDPFNLGELFETLIS